MGTLSQFNQMLDGTDTQAREVRGSRRQLEILIPSGTNQIHLRLGRLNSQDDGDGFAVHLDKVAAQELGDALFGAIARLGEFIR